MITFAATQSNPWNPVIGIGTAVLAIGTVVLGWATWRMASATNRMLTKADEEVELAQKQVGIASEQVQISLRNEFASRQPILVPAIPSKEVVASRQMQTLVSGPIPTSNSEFSSFWTYDTRDSTVLVCLGMENIGAGVAMLPTNAGVAFVKGNLNGECYAWGRPSIRAIGPGARFEIVFGPMRPNAEKIAAESSVTGGPPGLQLEISYTDISGQMVAKSVVAYESLRDRNLSAIKTEYAQPRDTLFET
jgi:hypothetical protein